MTGPASGGSYGNPFAVGASGLVVVDLPVDGAPQDGLFVQKDASVTSADVGSFVDYTVRVRNGTGNALDRADVMVADDLPAGFGYMAGTARLDGRPIADPAGGLGPHVAFTIGHLARDQQVVLTYRVRLGPGSQQGDGVNRAQAAYRTATATTVSNVASAKVQVTGGVFSDQGFILGKVFLDCNADGVQERGEAGMPGVRVLIEDGTYAITDDAGQFSFYGLDNRTHVVKVDRTTLPPGARLEAISSRNLGDGGSRIADLKAGEMLRADFAIEGCGESIAAEAKSRAKAAHGDELGLLAGAQLATVPAQVTDPRALPASGVVAIGTPGAMPGAANGAALPGVPSTISAGFDPLARAKAPAPPSPAPRIGPVAQVSTEPLEALLPKLDRTLAFVGLVDGETLPYAQATVRVKGTAGSTFHLKVNGVEVPEKRVGKRAVLAEKQVQAWEYIGVALVAGENVLELSQVDSFGNPRGSVAIHVIAPGEAAKLAIELPGRGAVADGKTAVRIVVKLLDAHGVPVTARTPLTLEATLGKWQVKDLDPAEAGVQTFVEGGRAELALLAPSEPGAAVIVATSGTLRAETRLDFLPELRKMVAAGVVEGIINMRNLGTQALQPTRVSDGFEQELRQLSREWNNGRTQAGARAAFYLKGKIKGEYLLTAAYDSDKDTQERLFRDIQPDEFYPVYGDSSVRGYDAQSTSKLYVRVDHGRSYLLWGDFTTASTSEVRKLGNYSRSLTGVREHFENSRVSVNAFASRDTTRQVIEEFPANGTSGPFQLGTQGALVNSEKVEILTRDRNQPALILSTVAQTRFVDYEIETLTGRILFKAPVPSLDRDLNPVSIRVTYEVDQGGAQFWVAGVDGQVKLTDRVEAGGIYVKDQNPLAPFTLGGADLVVKLGQGTYVITEAAHTEAGLDDHKGNAARFEIKHDSANLKAQVYAARTDTGFDNPGAYISQGRGESGGRLEYRLSPKTTIKAQALRTEDASTGSVRDGEEISVQHQLRESLTLELGLRHAAEKGTTSPVPPLPGQPAPAADARRGDDGSRAPDGRGPGRRGRERLRRGRGRRHRFAPQGGRGGRGVPAAPQEPHLRAPRIHLLDHRSLRPQPERAAEHHRNRRRDRVHEGRAALQRVPYPRRDVGRRRGGCARAAQPLVDRARREARDDLRARARVLRNGAGREQRRHARPRVHRERGMEGQHARGAAPGRDPGFAAPHGGARGAHEPRLDRARAQLVQRHPQPRRRGQRRARDRAHAGRARLPRPRQQPLERARARRASPGVGRFDAGRAAAHLDAAPLAQRRLAAGAAVPRERALRREVGERRVERARHALPCAGRRHAPHVGLRQALGCGPRRQRADGLERIVEAVRRGARSRVPGRPKPVGLRGIQLLRLS